MFSPGGFAPLSTRESGLLLADKERMGFARGLTTLRRAKAATE